jgi:uncharacterized metal-binding protein (TIGR02443 family)
MQDLPRRRFIAGAVCPRCALMDKTVVDLDTDQRVCVSCGFSEARPGLPGEELLHKPAELLTRVSRAAARRVETPAQAITLIDSHKERDGHHDKPQD